MAITTHIFEVHIAADLQKVWKTITDEEWQKGHLHSTGTLEVMAPTDTAPGRIVQTWRVLSDAEMAAEAPSETVWTVEAVGPGLTLVRVVHGDLAFSPLTWAHAKQLWGWTLDALKTTLETGRTLPQRTRPTTKPGPVGSDWHRAQGVEANNATWELLGSAQRTPEQDEDLLRRAYAAAYHWQRADSAKPENEARAAYLIAKALLATGQAKQALISASHCLDVCLTNQLGDFDLAYAHEARTRGFLALGDLDAARTDWAKAATVAIADPEDQAIVEADFADLVCDPALN